MAIGAITMILANVGLQIYNNWCSCRQNEELQRKREEFERAAHKRNKEHMWKLLKEGQELAMQLERERHEERLIDLKDEFKNLLHSLAYEKALANWPLNVPPLVITDQTLGNLLADHTNDCVDKHDIFAMHVIFARSNYDKFNKLVFPLIEKKLEIYCNSQWSTNSDHPILFYSGAWKPGQNNPTPTQVVAMRTVLNKVPTLVIVPFFRPHDGKLVFQTHMWGMGTTSTDRYDVPEIEPKSDEFHFQNTYTNQDDYENKYKLLDQIVEDLVPYLQCLIGYMADTYYWSSAGLAPHLPLLLADGTINTDGMKYLVSDSREYYDELLDKSKQQTDILLPDRLLSYAKNMKPIMDEQDYQCLLDDLLKSIAFNRCIDISTNNPREDVFAKNVFSPEESKLMRQFLEELLTYSQNQNIIELSKKDFNMEANLYSQKRDELIGIMDDLLKIEGISEKRVNEFKRIRKKCLENQFNIVLIGEFQGGKSTTFNAFCGGREISPRGAMIKTSACPITATNISEPDAEEFAVVQWKTDAELLMNIQNVLNKYIMPEDTDFDPESKELFEPYKFLHLSNPKHVELIKNAVEQEWQNIKNSPAGYGDEMDICRIADIILTFYDNSVVKEIKEKNVIDIEGEKRTICSIEEVSRIAVFPENWESKAGQGAMAFNADEVLFAFVGSIDCYIHSKNLERLGCSVTDCPGLFTSVWDTQVAFNTMPRADAVIYLLSGAKQMTDGDRKALSYIKNLETIENKLFFTINTREGEKVTNNIIETDKSIIESLGFQNVNIHLLNSQLFFLGEFGLAFLNNQLDDFSQKRFQIISSKFDIDEESLEDCWISAVQDTIRSIRKHKEADVDSLNLENIESIIKLSKSREVFNEIETFIIDKKAYSILIQGGANVVFKSLSEIEGELTRQENDALKDLATCEAEFASAQQALDTFQKEAKQIISEAFPEDVVSVITSRAYDKIIRNENTLVRLSIQSAQELVPVLGAKCKTMALELKLLETGLKLKLPLEEKVSKTRTKLKEIIEPVVKGVLERELGGNITEWVATVVKGEDRDYQAQIIPRLDNLNRKLNEKWESCVAQNPSIEAFKISTPAETFEELSKVSGGLEIRGDIVLGEATTLAVKTLIIEIIAQIVALVMATITMIVLDGLLAGGLLELVAAIVWFVTWIIGLISGTPNTNKEAQVRDDLNDGEKKLYDAIFPIMTQQLNKEKTIRDIRKGLAALPNQIIEKYQEFYYNQLEDQQADLKEDIRIRRENKQLSMDRQQEIARKAKALRENDITPMRQRVEAFILSCKAENVDSSIVEVQ